MELAIKHLNTSYSRKWTCGKVNTFLPAPPVTHSSVPRLPPLAIGGAMSKSTSTVPSTGLSMASTGFITGLTVAKTGPFTAATASSAAQLTGMLTTSSGPLANLTVASTGPSVAVSSASINNVVKPGPPPSGASERPSTSG